MATDDKAWENMGIPPTVTTDAQGNLIGALQVPAFLQTPGIGQLQYGSPHAMPAGYNAGDFGDTDGDGLDDDLYSFTRETEALLAVLLRPQGLTEQLAVAVLRASVAGHKKEMLAAAAALADLVKAELEG